MCAATALLILVGCSNKRDLGNIPDGGGGNGPGGTGSGTAGQGGQGGNAGPCDGGSVIICADDATQVCNVADCPPEPTGTAGTGGGGGGGTGGSGGSGGQGGSAGATGGNGGSGGSTGGTGGSATGGSGGSAPRCDLTKPFGPPTVVPIINSSANDYGAELADDLTLYFGSDRSGGGAAGGGGADLYVATRSSPSGSFTTAQGLQGINTSNTELWPRLTNGGLTLYYVQYVTAASGVGDIYVTSRSSVAAAFAPGAQLAQVNIATSDEGDPFPWRDGEVLYFVSNRTGTMGPYDIYVSTRRTDGSYANPEPLSEINSTAFDTSPLVTSNGLRIYWSSNRTDGGGTSHDIWTATRSSTSAPFANLARVSELNSDYADAPNWISPDGCKIYLTTTRPGGPGGQDIWEASRPPATSGTITEYPVPTKGSEPFGIVAGPDGNIWFNEYSAAKIGRITPAGTITEFPTGAPGEVPGIGVGPDGNLWFTEGSANKIGRITPAGAITEFPVPTAGSFPYGITAGPDGNLWFTENYGNRIGRVTTSGAFTEFSVPTANCELMAITSGPDGNLWFTEEVGNKIGRITPAGAVTEFPLPTASAGPWGITSGPDGNLWFTEHGANKIGRITPGGTFTEFIVPSVVGNPAHITAGPDGALWFAEEYGDRIGRLVP
jgi:streptogramin lyase